MAFNRAPLPVLRLDGIFRGLEVYKTSDKAASGPGRDAGRATVLTAEGGFLEVYFAPDELHTARQLGHGSDVAWLVEVDVFSQNRERADGTSYKWASITAKFIKDLDAAKAAHGVRAATGS